MIIKRSFLCYLTDCTVLQTCVKGVLSSHKNVTSILPNNPTMLPPVSVFMNFHPRLSDSEFSTDKDYSKCMIICCESKNIVTILLFGVLVVFALKIKKNKNSKQSKKSKNQIVKNSKNQKITKEKSED